MEKTILPFYQSYKNSKQNLLEIKFGIFTDDSSILHTSIDEEKYWDIMEKVDKSLDDIYYSVQTLNRYVYENGSYQLHFDSNREIDGNIKPKCIQIKFLEKKDYIIKNNKGIRILLKEKTPKYLQYFHSQLNYNTYHDSILSYRINHTYFINFIKRVNTKTHISNYLVQIQFIHSDKSVLDKSLFNTIQLLAISI